MTLATSPVLGRRSAALIGNPTHTMPQAACSVLNRYGFYRSEHDLRLAVEPARIYYGAATLTTINKKNGKRANRLVDVRFVMDDFGDLALAQVYENHTMFSDSALQK